MPNYPPADLLHQGVTPLPAEVARTSEVHVFLAYAREIGVRCPEALRSASTEDTLGNLVAKTSQGAVFAVTTCLLSNQPPEKNPRAAVHREAITGIGLVAPMLNTDPNRSTEKALKPQRHDRRLGDAMVHYIVTFHDENCENEDHVATTSVTTLPRAKLTKARARDTSLESSNSHVDDEMCGTSCFSRQVCRTMMRKGFKLPSDTPT
jgi:hypothetical protein